MPHHPWTAGCCAALLIVASGCVSNADNERVVEDAQGLNCGASSYTAFDPSHHENQDVRVRAQADIAARIGDAEADPSLAAEVFADVEALYQGSADLQAKVQGRADDHFPADPDAEAVGATIDAFIVDGIARGGAATSATDVTVAKQMIDKSLTRFFYLSVYHELVLGQRDKYDEAYGYLGTGPDNDPSGQLSIAVVASKRDGNNGTDQSGALFAGILDGSCALDKRLKADGAESIDWQSDDAYAAVVERLDQTMLEVLAASVGHELFTPLSELEPDEALIKLYEGAFYFYAVEDAMRAMGGTAASDAATIRASFDEAIGEAEAGSTTWQDEIDSDFIRDRVAAAFDVEIKG